MASSSNSRWQNCKECPNRSTNNGYITERAKRPVSDGVSLWHLCNYRKAELLRISSGKFGCYSYQYIYIKVPKAKCSSQRKLENVGELCGELGEHNS